MHIREGSHMDSLKTLLRTCFHLFRDRGREGHRHAPAHWPPVGLHAGSQFPASRNSAQACAGHRAQGARFLLALTERHTQGSLLLWGVLVGRGEALAWEGRCLLSLEPQGRWWQQLEELHQTWGWSSTASST